MPGETHEQPHLLVVDDDARLRGGVSLDTLLRGAQDLIRIDG